MYAASVLWSRCRSTLPQASQRIHCGCAQRYTRIELYTLEELKENFELLTEIATDLSLQFDGVEADSRKASTSTYYLAKMVHSCWSLNQLLPASVDEHFDFSSIAAICRNII